MKTQQHLVALILFTALFLAGCGSKDAPVPVVPEGAQAGDLTGLAKCEYQPADSKRNYAAECGTLAVPENWNKAASPLMGLPVVRIPASGPNPAEPVFYLQGGPGQSNFSWAAPDWLFENHDVVFVGYRGIDGAVSLSCPEVDRMLKAHVGKDLFSEQARKETVTAVRQCAATYQEAGVDLSGYTIPGVVEDLEAARIAMGYDRINLLSESYGTRVAQIYAQMHPDSLRRLVLIGVNTPGRFVWSRADLDELIEYISALCAQDAACSSRTSDFAQSMYDVNHNMPKRWLFFNIDPDSVRLGSHFMFLDNPNMPMIFDAYLAASEGDPSGLAMLNLMTSIAPIDQQIFGDLSSKAGSVDLERYRGIESVSLGDSIMGAPMAEYIWPLAKEWPIELIPKDLREFQESDVEMLLVNGTVDFSTPPTAMDEARPYYHKAQVVLLPEFSHIGDVMTLQPEAFERLITSYYDTGVADDALFVYQPLSFEPGTSLIAIARLLVAAMVFVPALIILGVVLGVRRTRRRRTMEHNSRTSTTNEMGGQYSLARILGIWTLAAAPMGILSWIVFPALSPDFNSDALGAGVTRLVLLTIGLIWLFALSMIIVRQEEGNLRWTTVRRRLWLNAPRDPKTGELRRRLWLWVIPFLIATGVWELALTSTFDSLWVSIFPFFAEPPGYSFGAVFESQEILSRLVGAWWFFGLFVVSAVFNTILGEEFLFRGVLLPKMEGVFGRWSWVANGALFGLYHIHQPWGMVGNVISGGLILAFPSWRFRSTWMAIIVHSAQSVFFGFLVLGVVLGLA
jgi:pimeloyl-ACP methyl ester carboxylesterase/membrane protease YdiL (CAAX protease family)